MPLSNSSIMTTITAASGLVDLNGKSHHGHLVPVNGGALLSPPNGANNTGANGAGETRGGGYFYVKILQFIREPSCDQGMFQV